MKLDNFTTARCIKCGWTSQFQPGREYESAEFECDCILDDIEKVVEKVLEEARPKPKPKKQATLMQENTDGDSRSTTKEDN